MVCACLASFALLTVQMAGKINLEQQRQTKELWLSYLRDTAPLNAEQVRLQHDLEASGGHQAAVRNRPPQSVAAALDTAADLEHCIMVQQERYLYMLSRFIFQILSPFQIGHLSGAAYPFTLQWTDLIASVVRQADQQA